MRSIPEFSPPSLPSTSGIPQKTPPRVDPQRMSWMWTLVAGSSFSLLVIVGCSEKPARSPEKRLSGTVISHGPVEMEVSDEVASAEMEGTRNIRFEPVAVTMPASPEQKSEPAHVDLFAKEAIFHPPGDKDFVLEGNEHLQGGRIAEAVTSFRNAVYDDDTSANWNRLGAALLENGDASRGVPALEHALKLNPQEHSARQPLVRVYLNQGKIALARKHAERLCRGESDNMPAQYLLGLTYLKSEMWNEAIQAFSTVVKAEPENVFARNNLGFAALQIGKYDQALAALELLVEHEDVRASMLNNLGVAYEKNDRIPEAIAAYRRAVELQKGYVKGIVNVARLTSTADPEALQMAQGILEEMRTPTLTQALASAHSESAPNLAKRSAASPREELKE